MSSPGPAIWKVGGAAKGEPNGLRADGDALRADGNALRADSDALRADSHAPRPGRMRTAGTSPAPRAPRGVSRRIARNRFHVRALSARVGERGSLAGFMLIRGWG